MAVALDKTLILIVQNKDAFLSFIDLIDNPQGDMLEGDTQIPIAFYNRTISDVIKRHKMIDGRRLSDALSLDNLARIGLLLDWNKRDGYLTFTTWFVDMLRQLDDTRLKELSDKNLNDLHNRLENLVVVMTSPDLPMVRVNPDFREAVAFMFKTLNEVNDSLQQNVRSLEAQSRRLSEILDSDEVIVLAHSQQRREALDQVYVLQERHIKPMMQFIDEHQDYKKRKTPLALIQRLEKRMTDTGFPDHTSRLITTRIRILSHGKKIKDISRLLRRYIQQDQEERHRYNAIEVNFNQLLETSREVLRDGNQHTRYIPSSHPVFDTGTIFLGLKTHTQKGRTKISWDSKSAYPEYITEKLRSYRESVLKRIENLTSQPHHDSQQSVNTNRIQRTENIRQLMKAMESFNYRGTGQDAYELLHAHLSATLDNYWLGSVVDALPILKVSGHYRFTYQREINEFTYNGYRLRYHICTMEPLV